ncbi:MAG: hypothetical protein BRD30_07780 [Bacteroidetes bacterium QH_2_63_10]|nr:MAG: hypothetical protein BRD30_07780 [Bacteroidetes bacterium QH_2_63_10]
MSDSEPPFFERVWEVVARIPPGRVTTYGDIAEHLGRRGAARIVGWALNEAVGTDLPCHRVVNRDGVLTGKRHFETPHVMEERLRSEGAPVETGRRGDVSGVVPSGGKFVPELLPFTLSLHPGWLLRGGSLFSPPIGVFIFSFSKMS